MSTRLLTVALVLSAVVLAAGSASGSEEDPAPSGPWPSRSKGPLGPWPRGGQLYLSGGLNLGVSLQKNVDNGLVVGAETSLTYWATRLIWTGLYLDGLYDYGAEAFRFSVGPQVGVGPFGVDFGYLYEDAVGARQGLRLRALLTIGVVAVYGSWGYLPEHERSFVEIGLLLKFPVRLIPPAPRRKIYL